MLASASFRIISWTTGLKVLKFQNIKPAILFSSKHPPLMARCVRVRMSISSVYK